MWKRKITTLFSIISRPVVKRQKSGKFLVWLCLALAFFTIFSGCYGGPPPADGPDPPAHNGVFCSEVGTLTFNGDGESITVCFEDDFAAEAGFPLGECDGTYVFRFQQKEYRYDKAEYLCIYVGEKEFRFCNNFQETNEDIISVISPVNARETLRFMKI